MLMCPESFGLIVISTVQSKFPIVSRLKYIPKYALITEMYHNLKRFLVIVAFEK